VDLPIGAEVGGHLDMRSPAADRAIDRRRVLVDSPGRSRQNLRRSTTPPCVPSAWRSRKWQQRPEGPGGWVSAAEHSLRGGDLCL